MDEWRVFHSDGTAIKDENGNEVTTKSLEYSGSWMGECFVSVTFRSPVPISFKIGDYLTYRGERFEINYDPGKIKSARKNTYGESFVYDSVKFNSKHDELARTEFLDIVLHDNQTHYTSLTKFPFYVSSLDDLLDRIQANLDEQWGVGAWKLYSRNRARSLQRGCVGAEWDKAYGPDTADNTIKSASITADGLTCWSALALVNSKFDVNFITRGRNVYVGTAGVPTSIIFQYGKGRGLYEIEQNADPEQSVTTRLRAYGSTKNLPNRYYATLNLQVFGNIKYVTHLTTTGVTTVYIYTDLEYSRAALYFTSRDNGAGYYNVSVRIGGTTIKAIVRASTKPAYEGKCEVFVNGALNVAQDVEAFLTSANSADRIYFVSGVEREQFPIENKDYNSGNLPNNMAVNNLMLPGFPNKSLKQWWSEQPESVKKEICPNGKEHLFSENKYRPYIDSLNVGEIGVRPNSVYFDNENLEQGIVEIYPTIEEMMVGGVRIDEIESAEQIKDNGVFKDGVTIPNFEIYLKPAIDFDINDLIQRSTDTPRISMKDGMCGGRDFQITSASKQGDGRWKLVCQRNADDALNLYYPYNDYQLKSGDHFVLLGIPLPDSYVEAASKKLLKYALAFLDKNDYTRYVYSPKIDEIFMARQHDAAMVDTTGSVVSIHDTIKEGDFMQFEDSDLHIDGQITIDQLTIREEDGNIPTYEITLREDKSVGTIQKIQEKISSLESGNGGSLTGNVTDRQVTRLIELLGGKRFLSKLSPDTAQGLITFLKGIAFKGKYGISELGEAVLKSLKLDGAEIDEEGRGTFTGITNLGDIVTKNLTVTGMMHIFTLVIDKVKSAGGAAIFTPADGFTVDKVEPVAGGYRLYWRATDGNGLARDNMWEAGDQALCHTDNRMRAGTAHNASNKLYWCLVTKTGTGVMADISGIPTECNYIDISTSDKLAGCVVNPETGDSIVMLGHRGDNERRKSAIYISAHSSLDPTLQAPLIAQYAGIDSFDISGKATSSLAFDARKLRTMLKVNGDAYIGDGNDNFIRYTPEHGLEVSAVAHFKAGTTGGENIDGISASGANLIVNSGFTGNYESIEVSESTPVSGETPVFSPALFGWSGTAIVSKDADSASGFSASLSGAISQAIPTIVPGLPYAFTAKAKGRDITVSVGGVERIFRLSGQYQTISFVAVPAVGESFSMSGDCTVCEPMLVSGRTLAAWQPGAQDNDRSMGELHALRSLTEAIQQSSTRVVGGFVLTQTVKVGNYRNKVLTEETGGMSGYRVSDNSPYIWGGGTLAQAHYTINKYAADPSYQATEEELKKMAKFVVTHGGRAILNDMILRGYVYAEGGVFKNVSSPNGNFTITETGDVKIKGEINASSGKIAGIEIHGNYLGSEIKRDANGNIIPWSGPNGRFGLYSDMISFSSPDGRQVILGTWNNFGVPLMVRMSDNRPDFMPKYGIVFDIANSAFGQDYAFIGRGNGILNGVMDSYRYRRLILAEDNTVYNINDPQSGNRVFVFTDKDHTDVSLPKLSAMKVFLGMSADSTEPFSIPLVIMGDLKTKGFSVFGRNDRKVRDKDGKETKPWAGDEYPLIVSYNVAEWLPTVGMAEGDVLEFMLTYDPGRDSESDRIDGKTIVYTARLIRFLQ